MADLFRAPSSTGAARPGSPLLLTRLAAAPATADDRDELAELTGTERPVRQHAELLREGAASEQLFVLLDGWACRYMTTRNGDRQIVALLLPGDLVNLDAIGGGKPACGVRMISRGAVAAVSAARLGALAARHSGIGAALMRAALIEAAILRRWGLCLGRQDARQRVVHLLCEVEARLSGGALREQARFDWPLTQEQLSDAVGLTAVHVNRMLRSLKMDGLVEMRSGNVVLPDVRRLRAEAEFDPAYLYLPPAPDARTSWQTPPGLAIAGP